MRCKDLFVLVRMLKQVFHYAQHGVHLAVSYTHLNWMLEDVRLDELSVLHPFQRKDVTPARVHHH